LPATRRKCGFWSEARAVPSPSGNSVAENLQRLPPRQRVSTHTALENCRRVTKPSGQEVFLVSQGPWLSPWEVWTPMPPGGTARATSWRNQSWHSSNCTQAATLPDQRRVASLLGHQGLVESRSKISSGRGACDGFFSRLHCWRACLDWHS